MKRQLLAFSLLASTTFAAVGPFSPAQAANTFTFSEREKNNTDSTAQVLPEIFFRPTPASAQYVVKGSIFQGVPGDVDVYRVEIGAHSHGFLDRLTLDVTAYTATLYFDHDGDGQAETSEQVISVKGSPRALAGMRTGTYFIKVAGTSLIANSPYTLTLQVALTDGAQKEVEPNNTSEQATVVQGAVVGFRYLRGSFIAKTGGSSDGIDYYRFTVGTARPVRFMVQGVACAAFLNLSHDKNRNGRVDSGELLQNRSEVNRTIYIEPTLPAGEYILQVVQPFCGLDLTTNYSIMLTGRAVD